MLFKFPVKCIQITVQYSSNSFFSLFKYTAHLNESKNDKFDEVRKNVSVCFIVLESVANAQRARQQ